MKIKIFAFSSLDNLLPPSPLYFPLWSFLILFSFVLLK